MPDADCMTRALSGAPEEGRPAEGGRPPGEGAGEGGGVHCVVRLMWSMYSRRPSCCRTSQPFRAGRGGQAA
jgi:hypothetical protein